VSLLIDGKMEDVPGVLSFTPGNLLLTAEDCRPRRPGVWVRSIILHTTKGDEPQIVRPMGGSPGLAEQTIRAWHSDRRHAGAHLVISGDGSVFCVADLQQTATYHAESINEYSIGIELAQSAALEIWQFQIETLKRLLLWLTARFGIQRQYHAPYLGEAHPVARLAAGGRDCVGVFGHRDQTTERGPGDPGDAVFTAMADLGFEAFNFDTHEDLRAWMPRQQALGVHADGEPGPLTVAALKQAGYIDGLWVQRAA
jgi:hypothetical protein